MRGARIVSNLYRNIYETNNKSLINLYFYINFCLKASRVNSSSFIENALSLKDKYSFICASRRDLTEEIFQMLDIEYNNVKIPGFLTKTDRIFSLVIPDINNINFDVKERFFELVNKKDEINDILKSTKTNA